MRHARFGLSIDVVSSLKLSIMVLFNYVEPLVIAIQSHDNRLVFTLLKMGSVFGNVHHIPFF